MPNIAEYKIITADVPVNLTQKINKAIEEGWQPFEGIIVGYREQLTQIVVRYTRI